MNATEIDVRGGATPDEIAAVIAALSRYEARHTDTPDIAGGYDLWRRTRLAALAASAGPGGHW